MKLLFTSILLASLPSPLAWSQGTTTQPPASGGTSSLSAIGPFVRLQPGYPGTAQVGNSNITGASRASLFVAECTNDTPIQGYCSGLNMAGVYGENWPSYGVVGRSNYVAVWGDNLGGGVGVHGASVWPGGTGVYAEGGTEGVFGTGGTFGVVGVGTNQGLTGQGTYGVVSFGTAHVQGDLVVTGSKTGYVVDLIRNGDSVPLAPGELVEIVGSEPAVLGDIPVAVVRRASAANAQAVLGPISNALTIGPDLGTPPRHLASAGGEAPRFSAAQAAAAPGVLRVEGAILPGGYGNVVTLGAFRAIKVDARFGAIRAGDLLVASPELGFAMSDAEPRVGTVVGKALAPWSAGQGEIPVMIGMR